MDPPSRRSGAAFVAPFQRFRAQRESRGQTPARGLTPPPLPRNVLDRAVVLVADELDQLLVDHDALGDADRERLGVGLRVVDRDRDVQLAEPRPREPLGDLALIGQRTPPHVEPAAVDEVVRLHHERVALPAADRVAVPPGLGPADRRQGPAVQFPDRSGFPSASRGVGAFRSGPPSASRGTSGVGYLGHCAERGGARATATAKTAVRRSVLAIMAAMAAEYIPANFRHAGRVHRAVRLRPDGGGHARLSDG